MNRKPNSEKDKNASRNVVRVDQRSEIAGRTMPESLIAEAAVLGSMIIDPQCISDVVEQINADAFYRMEHRIIFDIIVSLYEKNRGTGVDGVLVRNELENCNQLEEVGGTEYIAKIVNSVPSSANVKYYTDIVKDKQLLRSVITAATEILDEAYDQDGDIGEKLDVAEQKIFAITDKKMTNNVFAMKDLVTEAYATIEKREGRHVTGVATGYRELDELTCGLQKGEMIIIAARPSMGKTSLALNMAEHMAAKDKVSVGIFSLEMGRQQLAERFLCSISGVDSQLVRKGMLNSEHFQKLVEACGVLSDSPIYIDDTAGLSPLELRGKARRLKSKYDIKCLILDYLQLMGAGGMRIESRQQEITLISRHLKALARELDIPVVVISQLNRAAEGREDHRPRMSDLRESGSIEQDADVVMLLHREDYFHKSEENYERNNIAEVIIAKQRNGPTDTVKLVFMEHLTRFENMSQVSESF